MKTVQLTKMTRNSSTGKWTTSVIWLAAATVVTFEENIMLGRNLTEDDFTELGLDSDAKFTYIELNTGNMGKVITVLGAPGELVEAFGNKADSLSVLHD